MIYNTGDKNISDLVALSQGGEIIAWAWVFENDEWIYRKLTNEELVLWIKATSSAVTTLSE